MLQCQVHHACGGSVGGVFPFSTYQGADVAYDILSEGDAGSADTEFLYAEARFQHQQEVDDLDRTYRDLLRREEQRGTILQLDHGEQEQRQQQLLQRRQEQEGSLARAQPSQVDAMRQQQEAVWDEWWKARGRGSAFSDRRAMVAGHARLWLLRAALGDGCRHCVDPCADLTCPSCAGELDPDPGEVSGIFRSPCLCMLLTLQTALPCLRVAHSPNPCVADSLCCSAPQHAGHAPHERPARPRVPHSGSGL